MIDEKFLPRLDTFEDFGLPSRLDGIEDSTLEALDEINRLGCESFVEAHRDDYHCSDFNRTVLLKFCADKNVPTTLRNLEIAARSQSDLLEHRPPAPKPSPRKIVTQPVEGSAVIPPTDEERTLLEKTKDDPSLTDHSRKKRDELLRRAVVAQRRQFPHGEPQIVL